MNGRPLGGPGYDVVAKVEATIRRHGMIEPGATVLVGVSGGPDSVCLVDVLRRLNTGLGLKIVAAHVDHGLTEGSDEIAARLTRDLAVTGIGVHVMRAQGLEGPNLQARARELRYRFFETIAKDAGATAIATAHTLDDRVETTLARLIHGGGTRALAGIAPVDGRRIHPLIDIRRAETRAYSEECDLTFVDDPSNVDLRFERAAVRAEVLPVLEGRWGDGAVRAMAGSAQRLLEDAQALDKVADRLWNDMAVVEADSIRFSRSSFVELPRAWRRRLLERAVGAVRDRSGGIEAALDRLEGSDRLDDRAGKKRDEPLVEGEFDVAEGRKIVVDRETVMVSLSIFM